MRVFMMSMLMLVGLSATAAHAQPSPSVPAVAVPFYTPWDAIRGLERHHIPPLAQAFEQQAHAFAVQTAAVCDRAPRLNAADAAALLQGWQTTLTTWEALSTPAVGAVLQRRSQRQLDAGPIRVHLLEKALSNEPKQLSDLEHIGAMAKGFAAMEYLLRTPRLWAQPSACRYLGLLAQEVSQEARALAAASVSTLSNSASASDADTLDSQAPHIKAQYVEWLNQWLGGVERLRWTQLEKPIRSAQTAAKTPSQTAASPVWARGSRVANIESWRSQWRSLLALGRMSTQQRQQPPAAGEGIVPIEALLRAQGHIALADRWGRSLDAVTQRLVALPMQAPATARDEAQLLALASTLKAVTVLFQQEVATALDIPLGFSDADGD